MIGPPEHVAADNDGGTIVTAGESLVLWRLWDERVRALSRRPLAEIDPADIQQIRRRTPTLLAGERAWLDLITELRRCREEPHIAAFDGNWTSHA